MLNKTAKTCLQMILVGLLSSIFFAPAADAQEAAASVQNTAAGLRRQLSDVQAKEAELQARDRQLNEDLRPENIERSLAGVGSTRPEELREQRRRQLESEQRGVRAQLEQLAQSRARLESAIAAADAEAYRRSAQLNEQNTQSQATTATTTTVTRTDARPTSAPRRQRQRRRRARRH